MSDEFEIGEHDELLHYVSLTQSAENMYATDEKRIYERDIDKLVLPYDCTSFEFFDKVLHHLGDDFVVSAGEIVNRQQYYVGTVHSVSEMVKQFGADSNIVLACQDLGCDSVVKVYGNEYLPLKKGITVIEPGRLRTCSNLDKAGMQR